MVNGQVLDILEQYTPTTLKEMDSVKLLNRTDTKFVFHLDDLKSLLQLASKDYKVLTIDNKRFSEYKTLYFDTPNYDLFLDHHNGKGNRFKVRMRKYLGSNLCFLEIKNKFKGRTLKSRVKIKDFEEVLSANSIDYIENVMGEKINLKAALWNSFSRITLVNNELKERLTIDLGLSFEQGDNVQKMNNLIIAEVKQERANRNSPMMTYLKESQIRTMKISKFCVGCLLLDFDVKYNNFKEKLLIVEKIEYGLVS